MELSFYSTFQNCKIANGRLSFIVQIKIKDLVIIIFAYSKNCAYYRRKINLWISPKYSNQNRECYLNSSDRGFSSTRVIVIFLVNTIIMLPLWSVMYEPHSVMPTIKYSLSLYLQKIAINLLLWFYNLVSNSTSWIFLMIILFFALKLSNKAFCLRLKSLLYLTSMRVLSDVMKSISMPSS